MKLGNVKIGTRLITGFLIILLLTVMLGVISIIELFSLSNLTQEMYDHPLTVSNAVRDVKTNIIAMHRSMKDVALSQNILEVTRASIIVDKNEQKVIKLFDIIEDRFLGKKADIITAQKAFLDWKNIRDEVIALSMEGKKEEAALITRAKGAKHVFELNKHIQVMIKFAQAKANGFLADAIKEKNNTILVMIALLIVIILLALFIGVLLFKSITDPLNKVVEGIKNIANGDLNYETRVYQSDEIGKLADSFREMQTNLQEKDKIAQLIARGDFDVCIEAKSDKDQLAISINEMTGFLRKLSEANQQQDWLKSGQTRLTNLIQGEQDTLTLAQNIINFIVDYLNGQVGTFYIANKEKKLCLIASCAYTKRKNIANEFQLGEGLVGQAALEKKMIILNNIPDDYMVIQSGTGESKPKNLLILPCIFNENVNVVVELASIHEFTDVELDLLTMAGNSIAINVNSAETRTNLQQLLNKTQLQAIQLQTQQEELMGSNEELEEKTNSLELQTKKLKASEEELKSQQEELMAINEELEEKTQSLEKQKSIISQSNEELELARLDLEKKARELEITSKYKSEFLANMSHELRTPLNSLLILSQDLSNNSSGNLNQDQLDSVEIIHDSGNDLLKLINEILDLSKIEAGKMSLHADIIEIQELSDNIRKSFNHLAEEQGLQFNIQIEDSSPETIISDRQRLEQILRNLLSNAIKFTHHGSVTLSIYRPPTSLKLSHSNLFPSTSLAFAVEDTGIGIPDHKQLEIFEAFQQVDGSTSRQFGGTGLGLSISRELVKLLGGEIQLESQEGKGSSFYLYIPEKITIEEKDSKYTRDNERLSRDENRIRPETINNIPSPIEDDREDIASGDMLILVVEDDDKFAKLLKDFCHDRNLKFIHAADGETGYKLAKLHSPAAIILDINLPVMDGWNVLVNLKENSKTRHIPVHMMSVHDESIEAFQKGAIGYLKKPVNKNQLNSAFQKIEYLISKQVKELLIIEDDENMCKSIKTLIGNSDVKIKSVNTGKDAVYELKNHSYDCLILDLGLPDMSGFELLKKLKKTASIDIPPIIVYTGKELSEAEEYELEQYASSIVIKGVKSQERLLDETALFLHRIVDKLPERKKQMISQLHDQDFLLQEKKALLVDDDMRNVFAIAKILEEKNMSVIKAANGQKALEVLEENPDIDIILMDIMMPIMDGYEAMKRIKSDNDLKKIPIIALTAKAMKEDSQKCIDAGANDYIAKPVNIDRLLSLMRVWLYK